MTKIDLAADDEQERDPRQSEQDFTICERCGEDLPHHDCAPRPEYGN